MKPIRYTRHARSRMRQHRISEESVVLTVEQPEQLLPSIKSRYNAFKGVTDKIIRVTFIDEGDRILIVTVSPRKRL